MSGDHCHSIFEHADGGTLREYLKITITITSTVWKDQMLTIRDPIHHIVCVCMFHARRLHMRLHVSGSI